MVENMSEQEMELLIRERFKNGLDLHKYLTTKCKSK